MRSNILCLPFTALYAFPRTNAPHSQPLLWDGTVALGAAGPV